MSHRKAYLLFWNTPVHTSVCDLDICVSVMYLYIPVSGTTVHTCICSTMGCSNTFASFCRMMYLLSANDVNSTFRSFWGGKPWKDNTWNRRIETVTVSYRFTEMMHRYSSASECCVAVSSKRKTFQLGGGLVKVQTVKRAVKQCSKRRWKIPPYKEAH